MKNSRESLISRKHEVLRELTRARRQLEAARRSDISYQKGQRKRLESEVEQLMAEEYRLRIEIDRTK